MKPDLPPGFSLRALTPEDAALVAALITACSLAEGDVGGVDAAVIASNWGIPDFDRDRDAWLVIGPDGALAAYADLLREGSTDIAVDGYTHPRFQALGLGTALMARAEARAREMAALRPDDTLTLSGAFASANAPARGLYESAGFAPVRYFLHMHARLATTPDMPPPPDGVTIRPYEPGRDERAMYETMEAAFVDHWENTPAPYEEWLREKLDRAIYDQSLWFMAEADGETVGVVMSRYRGGLPWVQGIGVRRPWRGRGLGLALLLKAFDEFYRRGEREVALNVDADSPTGATRLYERAGMTVAARFDLYRKTLR